MPSFSAVIHSLTTVLQTSDYGLAAIQHSRRTTSPFRFHLSIALNKLKFQKFKNPCSTTFVGLEHLNVSWLCRIFLLISFTEESIIKNNACSVDKVVYIELHFWIKNETFTVYSNNQVQASSSWNSNYLFFSDRLISFTGNWQRQI